MEEQEIKTQDVEKFSCPNCGGNVTFEPGTSNMACPNCSSQIEIPKLDESVEELNFDKFLSEAGTGEQMSITAVACKSCGATSTLEPNITSAHCPYCDTPLVVKDVVTENIIQPKSILPFKVTKEQGIEHFKKWRKKLWFAPNALKKASLNFDHFKGVYVPFWTYDSDTYTSYTGQRGDHYYTTQTYTTVENGKTVTRTRQVQHTRWSFRSGHVSNVFDDVLVAATKSLPMKYLNRLEPWDLNNLEAFNPSFLAGYITQKYQVDLKEGFEVAKGIMDVEIRRTINRDIGGDVQRIITKRTGYKNITFKHTLLPVYISAYYFKKKLFRFLINGRTGEVQGERPWSAIKIILFILMLAAIGVGIYFLVDYLKEQKEAETLFLMFPRLTRLFL
ncbi:MAG: TFIIB-type zinc ribbon-containing protein [Bacteroidales bacterium]|nr:TFIIB-type zinc ribbon-containing protein [Bacteroidales bacterium]